MNEELINYRKKRAKETLEDAKTMFGKTTLFSTVNRIYYSIFYEVTALLLTKGFSSSKHSGVRSIFNREFVKTGLIKKDQLCRIPVIIEFITYSIIKFFAFRFLQC